jgi:hypothetical protein
LGSNTIGSYNTAVGNIALGSNTIGINNTAVGNSSLQKNTSGADNTANGSKALYTNTTGASNTAIGTQTLYFNTSGDGNSALGLYALYNNSTGRRNTALGGQALSSNKTGSNNVALGYGADVFEYGLTNATAIGSKAIVTTSNTIQLGDDQVTEVHAGVGVNSTLVTGGLRVLGGVPGNGKILVSDSHGNATWKTAQDLNGQTMIYQNGTKILVGSTNPTSVSLPGDYGLYVLKGILTERVKVAINGTANWADYVFENKYKLKTLEEVEQFISKNKHLPNIPSAAEVVKEGIDVASMDAKLLEKIEELTLYMIELNKKTDAQGKKIEELQSENILLKKSIHKSSGK